MEKQLRTIRQVMDDHFIDVYKYHNGHMLNTSKSLRVTERTARNWRQRLESEGRLENITKTPVLGTVGRVGKMDKWMNRERWK